jgi:hypothetical protein
MWHTREKEAYPPMLAEALGSMNAENSTFTLALSVCWPAVGTTIVAFSCTLFDIKTQVNQ